MLTLGWSDGNSFLGIDFALLSSANKKNRYNEINANIDKRTCGYHRRQEAITKTTAHLVPMVKRALDMGVRAKYVLMDSWFSMPSAIAALREHIQVICMLKDHPKWFYGYQGKKLRLSDLYGKLKKKRGRARIKAQALVTLSNGEQAKIILFLVIKSGDGLHCYPQIPAFLMKKSYGCMVNVGTLRSFSKCVSRT